MMEPIATGASMIEDGDRGTSAPAPDRFAEWPDASDDHDYHHGEQEAAAVALNVAAEAEAKLVYGDLDSKLESLASDTLREQLVQARGRIADLEFAARSKDVNLRRTTDQVAILIVNISSLYHTAKVEMERKDALIRQLQSELQARKM